MEFVVFMSKLCGKYNYCSKKISSLYDQVMQMEVEPGSEETLDIGIDA